MRQTVKSIFTILDRQERVTLVRLILFDLLIGLLDISFLALLLIIVNYYTKGADSIRLPFVPPSWFKSDSLLLIGMFCLLFGLKNWFGFAGLKKQHHFFYKVASRLSQRNMQHYFAMDYNTYVHTDSSIFVRNISQKPIEFSSYILTNFQQVVSQGVLILFTIGAILFYHPGLFLLLFLLLAPPVAALGWFIRKKLKQVRLETKTTGEKTLQHLHESLAGYVEGNTYEKSDFFTERFHQYQRRLDDNIATQQTWQSLPSRLIEVFAVAGFFVLVAINQLSAGAPAISLITIGVFMAAAYKIIPGIIKILNSAGQMKTYHFVIDALQETGDLSAHHDEIQATAIRSIEFQQVYFKHGERQVLSNLRFRIDAGDFVGLSAPSGSGKTTIVNLLLGFLQPDCGQICINGEVVDTNGQKTRRQRVSYVKQQPFFIHDTMLKNITLSDNAGDTRKLYNILQMCGLEGFVEKYPEGTAKLITENGKNISGGERQRLMLARALYHDFDLLILDEPFSELDACSERAILGNLQALTTAGKMILLITHNQPGLSFCNKIIKLDGK